MIRILKSIAEVNLLLTIEPPAVTKFGRKRKTDGMRFVTFLKVEYLCWERVNLIEE
jgi:hypothetical protein